MKSWEKRAATFHFRHRTSGNDDKVSLITSHAFKFNKPIELDDNDNYIKIGQNWRLKQVGTDLVIQHSDDGVNWTSKWALGS